MLQTHPCECAFTMLANTTSGPPPSLEEAARKTSPPSLYSFAPWRYVFEICCCVFGLLRAGLVVLDVRCCGNLCDRQRAQEAWRPQSPAWRVGGGNLGRALAGVLQQPGSRWGSALWGSPHSGWGGCGAPASGACVPPAVLRTVLDGPRQFPSRERPFPCWSLVHNMLESCCKWLSPDTWTRCFPDRLLQVPAAAGAAPGPGF